MPYNYRYYIYSDNRWIGPTFNSSTRTATQSFGNGAEPSVSWSSTGIYLPAGTRVTDFALAGILFGSDVVDVDLRLYFQHGSWNGGWNSSAGVTRDTLYSANNAGIVGDDGMQKADCAFYYTTPADGYFMAVMRANAASTLATTRYFYTAGALGVTLPPSA